MTAAHFQRRIPILAVGLLAGILSGLLGIGGGLLLAPVLVMLGLSLKRAFGTALAVVAPVAAVGATAEGFVAPEHWVLWAAFALAIGGQLGVGLGSWLMRRIPDRPLRWIFVLLVWVAAARCLGFWGVPPVSTLPGLFDSQSWVPPFVTGLLGIFAGLCAALFGVGGGIVMVPGLVYLVGGFSFHQATGTSLLAMVPTSIVGVVFALRDGRVQVASVRRLLPSALVGAILGVFLRDLFVPATTLSFLFGLFLVFVAVQFMRQGRR